MIGTTSAQVEQITTTNDDAMLGRLAQSTCLPSVLVNPYSSFSPSIHVADNFATDYLGWQVDNIRGSDDRVI
jgi:hypothetical protein